MASYHRRGPSGGRGGRNYGSGVSVAHLLKNVILIAAVAVGGFLLWQSIFGGPKQVVQAMVDADQANDPAGFRRCLSLASAEKMVSVNQTPLFTLESRGMGVMEVKRVSVGETVRDGAEATVPVEVYLSSYRSPGDLPPLKVEYRLVKENFLWKVDLDRTKFGALTGLEAIQALMGEQPGATATR